MLRLYDDGLLYLDRYWREEQQVCDDVLALAGRTACRRQAPDLEPAVPGPGYDEQRAAAEIALAQSA